MSLGGTTYAPRASILDRDYSSVTASRLYSLPKRDFETAADDDELNNNNSLKSSLPTIKSNTGNHFEGRSGIKYLFIQQ